MPRLEQVGGSPSVAHAGGGTRTATWKGTCGGTGASSSSPFITCAARTGARSAPLGVRRHTTDRHHPLIGYTTATRRARDARGDGRAPRRRRSAHGPAPPAPRQRRASGTETPGAGRLPADSAQLSQDPAVRGTRCAIARQVGGAHRLLVLVAHSGSPNSCKLRSENPATVAWREGGVSTARVPKRSGGLWTAGSGSVRTPRAARWSRARGRTSTRPRVCWAEACKASVHTPGSAALRRAVTSGTEG